MQMFVSGFLFAVGTLAVASSPAQERYPNAAFGGRLQLDYSYYDSDISKLDSGGEVRRARLFAAGNLAPDWDYKLQYDFALDDPELKDGYLRYRLHDHSRLWLGHFKAPFGLEALTSSKYITFIEPASLDTLTINRRLGVGYQRWGKNYTFFGSFYGDEANNGVNGEGMVARLTYTPLLEERRLLHLGIVGSLEDPDDVTFRIRARPEAHVDSTRLVDTGRIAASDEVTRWGLEAAYVNQRLSAQGEWIGASIGRDRLTDVEVSGGYIYVSFFLTDDQRRYQQVDGSFDRTKPQAATGAWEIALRYSTLDLTDHDVLGGEMKNLTAALNWYATSHLRFGANYIHVNTDAVAGNDDPNILSVRLQYDF